MARPGSHGSRWTEPDPPTTSNPNRQTIMSYTDTQLAAMKSDLESDRLERKRSASDTNKIRRSICALANDLPAHGEPGVILVGVEDDGRCSDTEVDDGLLKLLAGFRDDGTIIPLPSITVEKRILDGCEVAVILVHPSRDTPVRFRGRTFVRVGPSTRQATAAEEQVLAERRRARDLPFDSRPCAGATIDDLDLDYVQSEYLPSAVAQDVLDENQRPLTEQLRSLRLVVDGVPTWGALLGLAPDPLGWFPGAYVHSLRVDGPAITDPIVAENRLDGRLVDVLRGMVGLLRLNISTRIDMTSGPTELRLPDYPIVALQQLALNAVMHRSYEGTNAPVRINWYADRIEIISPGGLYGLVTPDNFGQGVTDYRNPLLAEVMHHLGFAQRFGVGVPLARLELERNGNPPPAFDFTPTHLTATVWKAP